MEENIQTENNVTEEVHVKQTKKDLFWEIFRFLLVGGTATVFDYAVAYLFQRWLLPPSLIGEGWALAISTAMGFLVGLFVNWVLSITFVFKAVRDKKKSRSTQAFLTFALIGLIGLGISLLGMQLVRVLPTIKLFGSPTFLKEEWKWWMMKAVMTCIVLVWNYIGRKIFIFKS